MLEKVHFKSLYNSKQDDVINDFYIPALSQSNGYDRISAYFDSKILRMYAAGLENIKDGGRVRFIFSCDLDEEDYNLMKQGYDLREKITFAEAVESSTNELENYWENGGMIDFSKCEDIAVEIEKEIQKNI